MPYSGKAKYLHHRQKDPKKFEKDSFKTVPISHTDYKGKKFDKKGVVAVVGKFKKPKKRAWGIQSILEPKNK